MSTPEAGSTPENANWRAADKDMAFQAEPTPSGETDRLRMLRAHAAEHPVLGSSRSQRLTAETESNVVPIQAEEEPAQPEAEDLRPTG